MILISMILMAQAAPAPATVTKPAEDKVMCRMIQEAYSRIPSRICRKRSEWDRMAKETEDDIRSSRNDRRATAMGNGG